MIGEIWASFRRLPGWVQIWVALILMPVNLMPLIFWVSGAPFWGIFAVLAVGGMALNLPILLIERGFSKAMAFPHILLWTPLVIALGQAVAQGGEGPRDVQDVALIVLMAVNLISLAFDYPDAVKWWRGDRAIA
ncbi:hypothetical protein [Shimia sediminis]|uniref:hypothetical protein n=1 Tax=Shimia sediminis TaxID=2497945 RepID=UPI000F8F3758|nr:hypothetical protein [Shimia sediminis]